jgi:hypothetical protein
MLAGFIVAFTMSWDVGGLIEGTGAGDLTASRATE